MVSKKSRTEVRVKKHNRMRNHLAGTAQRPRLAVFRSNNHMYAQIIDDTVGNTLVSASTLDKDIKAELEKTNNVDAAAKLGTVTVSYTHLVKVIAGKDINNEGKVIAVNAKNNTLLVEGINMVTKHTKPSMSNQQGGIVHQEAPIDASNVMLIHDGKPTRVGFKMDGDKKVRFAKSTGKVID